MDMFNGGAHKTKNNQTNGFMVRCFMDTTKWSWNRQNEKYVKRRRNVNWMIYRPSMGLYYNPMMERFNQQTHMNSVISSMRHFKYKIVQFCQMRRSLSPITIYYLNMFTDDVVNLIFISRIWYNYCFGLRSRANQINILHVLYTQYHHLNILY